MCERVSFARGAPDAHTPSPDARALRSHHLLSGRGRGATRPEGARARHGWTRGSKGSPAPRAPTARSGAGARRRQPRGGVTARPPYTGGSRGARGGARRAVAFRPGVLERIAGVRARGGGRPRTRTARTSGPPGRWAARCALGGATGKALRETRSDSTMCPGPFGDGDCGGRAHGAAIHGRIVGRLERPVKCRSGSAAGGVGARRGPLGLWVRVVLECGHAVPRASARFGSLSCSRGLGGSGSLAARRRVRMLDTLTSLCYSDDIPGKGAPRRLCAFPGEPPRRGRVDRTASSQRDRRIRRPVAPRGG